MPVQRPKRVALHDQMVDRTSGDEQANARVIDELQRLLVPTAARSRVTVDLVVGDNRVTHNLGRKPQHVSLMPTVADATFAWAVTEMDDRQLVVTVVGVAQSNASLEVS